jgi:hypothetical protein
MSGLNDLLAQLPIDQIAQRLGVDPATAEQAVQHALPALVGGLHANAQDPAAAASLADALSQHDNGLTDGTVDLDQVDTADGAKIVNHVFGANHDAVVSQLGGLGELGGGLVKSLLPMLAPIVMSYLAKQFLGGAHGGSDGSGSGGGLGGGLGGMLGQVLGGALGGGSGAGGVDLGSILGGLLGGGRR